MKKLTYERPLIKKLNAGLMNKFGTRTEYVPVTHIETVPVKQLLRKYGSPLFVISERKIRLNYQHALTAFTTRYPKVQFAWSYKTNYLNAVCNVFHQEGAWAEVVSGFEYQKAIANGVPGNKIIFNGPCKTPDELITAIHNGSLIHIDHFDELNTLIELSVTAKKKPRVAIRVNMDTGVYPIWDRFGFNYESGQAWNAIRRILSSHKMDLAGLHCHIGTFMLVPGAYAAAATKLSQLALRVKSEYGKAVHYLDLGGGFASMNTLKGSYLPGNDTSPTIDEFAEAITTAMYQAGFRKDAMPLLVFETGRALIDDTASLLGTVIAVKTLSDARRALVVDFGVNLLATAYWYDHKISAGQEFSHHTEDTAVFGPLCMNIDVIRENVNLPLLKKGDSVVVHKVGAYNMTQWMQFITLRPKIVMIDAGGTTHIIRDNETLNYLSSLEHVPDHLKII
jgi:diaminopimelate decarboxylase